MSNHGHIIVLTRGTQRTEFITLILSISLPFLLRQMMINISLISLMEDL